MTDVQTFTETLFVTQSRSMAYNSGAFISQGQACLIDPGPHPEDTERLIVFVATQRALISNVVLTHSHWDHVLGPERMRPELIVTTAAYREAVRQDSDRILGAIARWEAQCGYTRERPFSIPQPDETFDEAIELQLGKLDLKLIRIPGHAADQLAIYEPRSGALWAADTLSDIEIPFVSDSLMAYEASLAKLAKLAIRALVPGHGSPTRDQQEIDSRLHADRAYLAELRERVSAAVAAGQSAEEAVAACADMRFREPEENAGPHRLNVESAYIELGGSADPQQIGWR